MKVEHRRQNEKTITRLIRHFQMVSFKSVHRPISMVRTMAPSKVSESENTVYDVLDFIKKVITVNKEMMINCAAIWSCFFLNQIICCISK